MNKTLAKKKKAQVAAKFAPTMEQIRSLELELAEHPNRLTEMKVVHHHAAGLYARELHIPAGVMLTGKTHKTEHLCTISAGVITVWSENAGPLRLSAPCTFVSHPGARRVGFAHSDVVFTTYHLNPSNETDPDKILDEIVVAEPTVDERLEIANQEKLK